MRAGARPVAARRLYRQRDRSAPTERLTRFASQKNPAAAGFFTNAHAPPVSGPGGRLAGQRAALIVAHRLLDFFARIHHERSVLHDRLEQRPAGEQDDPATIGSPGKFDLVTIRQNPRMVCRKNLLRALRADSDRSLERVDEGMMAGWQRMAKRRTRRKLDVEVQ